MLNTYLHPIIFPRWPRLWLLMAIILGLSDLTTKNYPYNTLIIYKYNYNNMHTYLKDSFFPITYIALLF